MQSPSEQPRKRRRWLRWIGYLVATVTALVVLLACTGAIYEAVASHRDRERIHPSGQMVDVGGHRLHLYCAGTGSPTVILEAGGGNPALTWYKVQPRVAEFTRVCSYDRAGLGWSDPSPKPPTTIEIATELHALLTNAGISGPYVMVGHSLGGIYIRMFQHMYPHEVVGMVLVDSSHPDQLKRLPAEAVKQSAMAGLLFAALQYSRPLGVPRLMIAHGAPPEIRPEYAALVSRPTFIPAVRAEAAAIEENFTEVRPLGSLGDLPLAVLSHDPAKFHVSPALDEPVNRAWEALQIELSQLSTRGTRQVVLGASHNIEVDVPEAIVSAVQGVVAEARAATAPQS